MQSNNLQMELQEKYLKFKTLGGELCLRLTGIIQFNWVRGFTCVNIMERPYEYVLILNHNPQDV